MSKSKWILAGLLVAVLGAAAVQSQLRLMSKPKVNMLTESYYKLTRTPTESELDASDINPLPAMKVVAEVTYGPHGWRNTLDLYLPENVPRPMPLVVVVHGGGAENVSKDTEKPSPWAQLLLHRGYALAQINYRVFEASTLKPNLHNDVAAPFPAQLVDCKAAIRFLRSHAVEYEIDPNHIGVIGHSFGGHLSALIATTGDSHQFDDPDTTDTTSSAVQAAVDLCGVLADLPTHKQHVLLHAKALGYEWDNADAVTEFIDMYLGGRVEQRPETARLASPITHVTPGDPPMMIVVGVRDLMNPVYQADMLDTRLRNSGVSVETHLIPGAGHSAPLPLNRTTREMAADFFDRHLK